MVSLPFLSFPVVLADADARQALLQSGFAARANGPGRAVAHLGAGALETWQAGSSRGVEASQPFGPILSVAAGPDAPAVRICVGHATGPFRIEDEATRGPPACDTAAPRGRPDDAMLAATKHPNGACVLEGLTFVMDDPERALEPVMRRAGQSGQWRTGQGRVDLGLPGVILRGLTATRFARRYPGLDPNAFRPLAVVTVLVESLRHTRTWMEAVGLHAVPVAGNRLVAPTDQTLGVILEFAES